MQLTLKSKRPDLYPGDDRKPKRFARKTPPEPREWSDPALAHLVKVFPDTFKDQYAPDVRPIAVGIVKDIKQRTELSARAIRKAMSTYCSQGNYLRVLRPGAARIDLDGNEAGQVTDEQAEVAKEMMRKRKSTRRTPANSS